MPAKTGLNELYRKLTQTKVGSHNKKRSRKILKQHKVKKNLKESWLITYQS